MFTSVPHHSVTFLEVFLSKVDWQSIQRRYQEMFTNEQSEDKELMEAYKKKYGLEFIHPSLNGEVSRLQQYFICYL